MLRILFLVFIVLVGCHKQPATPKQSLRINIGTDPLTLDPRKARDLTTVTVIHMLFEGLTRNSKSGAIEQALAEKIDVSPDRTQYVFHLRKSLWSDGNAVTSEDFARSWKSLLDPAFPSDVAYQLYVIKNGRQAKLGNCSLDQVGIHTPDSQTLIVDLEEPIPYFLELLSMPSFYPIPNSSDSSQQVGNGPFILKSWQHADQIRVLKNPRYWQADQVKIEQMDLVMVAQDTEMRMFEEGKLDWAGSPLSTISFDAVPNLKDLNVSPFTATYFFRLNTADEIKGKKNPLSNVKLRKALAFALNRGAITKHILQGGQTPAKGLTPSEMGLAPDGYFADCDLVKAKALFSEGLKELNLTMETLEPITISYAINERNIAIAQAVQKQLEGALGLQVELEAVEPKIYFRRVSQKEFQIATGSWTGDFNDPINFLEVFKYKDASTNNTNWENGKYIELLNQSAVCRDSIERMRILREAETILMDQMPIIPVFHFALNYLQRNDLKDVALSPLGKIDFRWAHFEEQER